MHDSFQKYAGRLVLEPHGSRALALFIMITHGAAVAALWAVHPAWWVGLPGIMVIVAAGTRAYTRHVSLSHPRAVTRMVWRGGGRWRLVWRGGPVWEADLAGDSYVHPRLVVLNFNLRPTGRTAVVLFPGSLTSDDLRRLRVALKVAG